MKSKIPATLLFPVILSSAALAAAQTTEESKKILYPREPFGKYNVIIERNLFAPSGDLIKPSERKKFSLAGIFLTGIVYDGEKHLAIIEDRNKKTEGFFSRGDQLGEGIVEEINETNQYIIVAHEGESVTLSLSPLETPLFSPPAGKDPVSSFAEKSSPAAIKTRKSLFPLRERLGAHAREITPDLAQRLKLPSARGLYILNADKNSPSGFAGLGGGDILLEIGGKKIETIEDAQKEIDKFPAGSDLPLGIIKKGKTSPESVLIRLLKE